MPYAAIALGAGSLLNTGISWYNNKKAIEAQREANRQNIAYQREFAQNGILWRKQDAQRAGINPIYALGANGASFTPSVQAESGSGIEGINLGNFIALKQAKQQEKEGAEQIKLMQSEREKNNALKALYEAQTGEINNKTTGAGAEKTAENLLNTSKPLNQSQPNLNEVFGVSKQWQVSKSATGKFVISPSQDNTMFEQSSSEIVRPLLTQERLKREVKAAIAKKELETGTKWEYSISSLTTQADFWDTGIKIRKKELMKDIREIINNAEYNMREQQATQHMYNGGKYD